MDESAALHRLKTVEDRQATVRKLLGESGEAPSTDVVFDFGAVDPGVYDRSCESLTGHVSIPVGVVGPLDVQYRQVTGCAVNSASPARPLRTAVRPCYRQGLQRD